MARAVPHRSHMGMGSSAIHPHEMVEPHAYEGRKGDEDVAKERLPMRKDASRAGGGPIDMRPQPHEVMGTVGGIGKIAGPTLTGTNIGPLNAPVYESEDAEGTSGEL